ncbi:MAG: FAD-dependent monooxygenase [Betaproteobacteria bacterium]|jgi:3-(3-hydroxy-phenyl)propionate hydroxylase
MSNFKNKVLIVGAGPTGLVCALSLAKKGIDVEVFEKLPDRAYDLRASTIHPPTMQMLADLGIIDELINQGITSPFWQFRDRKEGALAIFDMSVMKDDVKYPFRLQCEQFKVTAELLKSLKNYPNAKVNFYHEAKNVIQDENEVTLTLECQGNDIRVKGNYLIAADGASSIIRHCLNINFEGYTFPERFLILSTPYEFKDIIPDLSISNYISDPDEWLVMLRVKEFWRVLFPTIPGENEVDIMNASNLQNKLKNISNLESDMEIAHQTLYHVHQRVATNYRVGRVLLAGDAAHINNPLGGMGMNGGIHDAVNLSEKLISVLEGENDHLLDRYSRQRRTVAIDYVQQWTVRNREILKEKDPAIRKNNLDELRKLSENKELTLKYLRKTSMLASLELAESIE